MLFPTYMYRVYHSFNWIFFYCLNRHFNMMKAYHLILIIHYLSTFYPSIRIIRTQSDNWWKIFYCCISILLVLKMMKYWLSIQRKRKLYSHHEQSKAFEIPVSLSEHKLYLDQNMLLSPRGVPTYKKLQSLKQI